MEIFMDVGIALLTVRTLFYSQEPGNFVPLKCRGDIQESPQVSFDYQDVVFRIDEQVVFVGTLGEQLLMREGQRPRILVWDADATFNPQGGFVDIRDNDDVDVEWHGPVFANHSLQVPVIGSAITRQRHENAVRYLPAILAKRSHYRNRPFQSRTAI